MTKSLVERKQRRWRWPIDAEGARPQSRNFVHQAPGRGGNTLEAMGEPLKLALGDSEGEAPGEREADADTEALVLGTSEGESLGDREEDAETGALPERLAEARALG
jgi:hypothetical protein